MQRLSIIQDSSVYAFPVPDQDNSDIRLELASIALFLSETESNQKLIALIH